MLLELRIRDLAIIDALDLSFAPGFNAISGETGAGKSIILHGLGLALGTRARADMVRAGADSARVEATFEPDEAARRWLRDHAIEVDDGEPVVLRRVVSASGRSRAFVNESAASASVLRSLGAFLVDYASQHESAVLLDGARHRAILDRFADAEALVDAVGRAVARLRDAGAELDRLRAAEQRRTDELELARFQAAELREVGLQPGEEAELEREREVLQRAGQLREALGAAEQILYSGEGAAVDQVGAALRLVRPLASLDRQLEETEQQVADALYALEDAARTLTGVAARAQEDPARLEEVDDRLEALRALQRKHRTDEAGLVERLAELDERVEALSGSAARMEELTAAVVELRDDAGRRAAALSETRRRAAEELGRRIGDALGALMMAGARFEARVDDDPEGLTATGRDQVAFQLAANAGEPLRPLSRIASGGELSRVLLAVKQVLRDASPGASFVLDEIDAGIGGQTAEVVGNALQQLAAERQLIVITHLPQIAARATAHFRVGKRERDGRTTVWAERLDDAARVEEVARMVAGERHTTRSRALAGEMLEGPSTGAGDDGVVT